MQKVLPRSSRLTSRICEPPTPAASPPMPLGNSEITPYFKGLGQWLWATQAVSMLLKKKGQGLFSGPAAKLPKHSPMLQSAPHLPICYYLELEARGAAQHVRMMWGLCCSPLMWYFLPRALGHSSMPQCSGTVWCDCLGWKELNTAMSWLPLGMDAGAGNALSHVRALSAERSWQSHTCTRGDRQQRWQAVQQPCLPPGPVFSATVIT